MQKKLLMENMLKTIAILAFPAIMMWLTGCATGGQSLPTTQSVVARASMPPRQQALAISMVPWPQEYIAGGSVVIGIFQINKYASPNVTTETIRIEMLPEELAVPFVDISVTNEYGETVTSVVEQLSDNVVVVNLYYKNTATFMDYLYIKARIQEETQPGMYAYDLTIFGTVEGEPFDAAFCPEFHITDPTENIDLNP